MPSQNGPNELTPAQFHVIQRVSIMLEEIYRREISPMATLAYLRMARDDLGRVLKGAGGAIEDEHGRPAQA